MKFKVNRNIILRETGIVIPPVYWLEASADGLVYDLSLLLSLDCSK